MTGLQLQIKARQMGKQLDKNEPISYAGIAKILNKPYTTAKRKILTNKFDIEEVFKIMESGLFTFKSKYDALEYLFKEQA